MGKQNIFSIHSAISALSTPLTYAATDVQSYSPGGAIEHSHLKHDVLNPAH